MGLTAVRSALCLFLQAKRVHKLILDCPNEEEQLKPKRYPDLNNVKIGHGMDPCECIHKIGILVLVYHILLRALYWYGQKFRELLNA